jgi:carboxypeptidase PM20D1
VAVSAYGMTRSEPSPESPADSSAFATLQRTIMEVFPGAIVTPSLVLGATDSRHYLGLGDNVYRFLPLRVTPGDLRRPHGTNERIAIDDYENVIRFYGQLIRNLDRAS